MRQTFGADEDLQDGLELWVMMNEAPVHGVVSLYLEGSIPYQASINSERLRGSG